MSNTEQFKQTYITECFELLSDMEAQLLELDLENPDKEQLNAIFRCAHSIKGGAGAFGLDYITEFTHILEAVLDSMRDGNIYPDAEIVDVLLKSVDVLNKMVTAAQNDTKPKAGIASSLIKQLHIISNSNQAPKIQSKISVGNNKNYKIRFFPHTNIFASGNEPLLILRELSSLGKAEINIDFSKLPDFEFINPIECFIGWNIDLVSKESIEKIYEVFEFVSDLCDLNITETQSHPDISSQENLAPEESNNAVATQTRSIRVDLEKIDKLINLVGEIVITEAMIKSQTQELPLDKFAALLHGVEELEQHTRELQEAVMSVRMQPVKSVFSRMPRIVHDISAQLGKDIKLVTSGENTEVDKTVIEQLGDPLTHMIRNSVDHGIETPEERIKAGKLPQGVIFLSAEHRGGKIIMEIKDDGAGINKEKVLAKAKAKNLIAPDANLSEEEIFQLVFQPGFSTSETVSNVSGRGVGEVVLTDWTVLQRI